MSGRDRIAIEQNAPQKRDTEAQKLRKIERSLPVSTRRRIKSILGRSPDLQVELAFCHLSTIRLPRREPSGDWIVLFLNTVAGPCRTHTGFPVMPSRAPKMFFDRITRERQNQKLTRWQNGPMTAFQRSTRHFSYPFRSQDLRRAQPAERRVQSLPLNLRSVNESGAISIRQNAWAGAFKAFRMALRITAGCVTTIE